MLRKSTLAVAAGVAGASGLRMCSTSSSSAHAGGSHKEFSLDPFAFRQFDAPGSVSGRPGFGRIMMDKQEFTDRVNQLYQKKKQEAGGKEILKDGYAPFCKHFFVENFTEAESAYLEITPQNEQYLKTKYEARRPEELPVLIRYFPADLVAERVERKPAKYLDIILYSREQIIKENAAMGQKDYKPESEPWGIISIKPQSVDEELPMDPITQMRNALPLEEGGSGTPLDRAAYSKSVSFWSRNSRIM